MNITRWPSLATSRLLAPWVVRHSTVRLCDQYTWEYHQALLDRVLTSSDASYYFKSYIYLAAVREMTVELSPEQERQRG